MTTEAKVEVERVIVTKVIKAAEEDTSATLKTEDELWSCEREMVETIVEKLVPKVVEVVFTLFE